MKSESNPTNGRTTSSDKSQIARDALDRIGKLYDIEREIAGQAADTRLAARQKLSKPKVEALKHWAEQQLTRIPGDLPPETSLTLM